MYSGLADLAMFNYHLWLAVTVQIHEQVAIIYKQRVLSIVFTLVGVSNDSY
jgi:hypothetical protein